MASTPVKPPPGFVLESRAPAPPPGFVLERDTDESPESGPSVPTTAEIFDLDPAVKERGVLLPMGRTEDDELVATPSDVMLDVMGALMLPGRVMQGHKPTPEELVNFTASFTGSAPQGALRAVKTVTGDNAGGVVQAADDTGRAVAGQAADDTGMVTFEGTADAAGRAARFEEQGIPATRGDITQDFAQQAEESRLVSMAGGAEAEPLRQMRLEQSEKFVAKANELVDSLGVPKRTGDSVKEALSGRKNMLRKEKNALYKEVAEAAPEVARTPIFTDEIVNALPDAAKARRLRRGAAESIGEVDALLVEFGINKGDEAVEAFIKEGGEITPLNLGNFDEFRAEINRIVRTAGDKRDTVSAYTGPIIRALDEEATFIDDAIKDSGLTDQGVVETLKAARARVRELKTEFSPQSISGRLIDTKRDGVTPVIEASKVSNELLRPGAPIENLQRTLQNLRAAGKKGKIAIQDLQSSVILDAVEAGLKAPSRKTSGIETIGGNQFAKSLDKFGDDKLDLLFSDSPEILETLRGLKQTARDITPTAGAVPKGSAPVILDLVERAGKLPGLAAIRDIAKFVVNAGSDERAVKRAMTPPVRKQMVIISRNYPALARSLGILQALELADGESGSSLLGVDSPVFEGTTARERPVGPEEVI